MIPAAADDAKAMTRVLCLLTLLAAIAGAGAATAAKPSGARLFALVRPDTATIAQVVVHSEVDGISLQAGWSELEVEDGVYRWDRLDWALKATSDAHKRVSLALLPLPRPPRWLEPAGAKMVDATSPRGVRDRVPVPWDEVYLAKFSEFLPELARHLRAVGLADVVVGIGVAAPVPEMSLFPCRDGSLAPGIVYDRAAYLAAWKRMVDVYQSVFPKLRKLVSAPVGVICFPERDETFYREVIGDALERHGHTFWVFAADLNSRGSQRMSPYADLFRRTSLAYQTIWSATDDPDNRMEGHYPGNLKQAVCKALADGARHIELYAVDVLNPNAKIQAAVKAVHKPRSC